MRCAACSACCDWTDSGSLLPAGASRCHRGRLAVRAAERRRPVNVYVVRRWIYPSVITKHRRPSSAMQRQNSSSLRALPLTVHGGARSTRQATNEQLHCDTQKVGSQLHCAIQRARSASTPCIFADASRGTRPLRACTSGRSHSSTLSCCAQPFSMLDYHPVRSSALKSSRLHA